MTSRTLTLWFIVILLVIVPAAAALQAESTEEPTSTAPTARVTATVLNVRDQPSISGQRIGQVRFGETYPVLLGNADGSWWQIQLPDATGWVSGDWVTVSNEEAVPLDPSLVSQQQTAAVRVAVLNVRSEPSLTGEILTQVRLGETYRVLQQNPGRTWWQTDVNGTLGWVNAAFVNVVNFAFSTAQPAATQEATQEATVTPTPSS